jgi:hypothetical protein
MVQFKGLHRSIGTQPTLSVIEAGHQKHSFGEFRWLDEVSLCKEK